MGKTNEQIQNESSQELLFNFGCNFTFLNLNNDANNEWSTINDHLGIQACNGVLLIG